MRRLFISFSGGRTSAYMTWRILSEMYDSYDEIIVLFANTGQEHEETLKFIRKCDEVFGFKTIWVEAVVNPMRGCGTTHRVVDYHSASRDGRPFEDVISKYGIPNKNFPHCTRELKQNPMYSYLRSLGWEAGSFDVAVGIRADEIDRISKSAKEKGIIYPLIKWNIRKQDIISWWVKQEFNLYLPEHLGNCTFCWKKSLRKHMTLAIENPSVFYFPARMEQNYADAGPGDFDRPRKFFRKNLSTDDILKLAVETEFEPFVDENHVFDPVLDLSNGCEDSCEVFTDSFMRDLVTMGGREDADRSIKLINMFEDILG